MKDIVKSALLGVVSLDGSILDNLISVPPSVSLGDFSFPCFVLSKELDQSPVVVAKVLSEKLSLSLPSGLVKVVATGPYLNFFVDRVVLAKRVLKDVKKKSFGSNSLGKGKVLGVEFSQPNTHKAFHVGHIRGTSLGESLCRIAECSGHKVVRINYSGDTGMHIAKWLWCYEKFHVDEPLVDDESWIASVYVDAVKRLEGDDSAQLEVEVINRKLESKDDERINSLWERTRSLSIKSWERIYRELNTRFDKHYYESEMEVDAKRIAEELLDKKIALKDDAIFMDLKEFGLSVWVLIRKDGTVLYSAKDLALALRKMDELSLDESLVCVGDEQQLHFRQLVKTLELMGFSHAKDYGFLTFGMVRFPEGKMSSRTGKNVLYSDFFLEVSSLAKDDILKRGYNGADVEVRAKSIALAAIKYTMLKQDHTKVLIFNPEESVSFEGDTGVYLLYSYARASSIIRKVDSKKKLKLTVLNDKEFVLVKKIDDFSSVVKSAYLTRSPSLIAHYAFGLAQTFNDFYHSCPVLGDEHESFRLSLVDAFRITMKKTLDLLGIDTLEEM